MCLPFYKLFPSSSVLADQFYVPKRYNYCSLITPASVEVREISRARTRYIWMGSTKNTSSLPLRKLLSTVSDPKAIS